MKPIIKNILAGFAGSLVSIALFIGVIWCIDKFQEHQEEKANLPLNEKVLAYLDKHDIPYEEVDTFTYVFTYNDDKYFYRYDPEDPEYMLIISSWAIRNNNYHALLETANELQWKKKFIKIRVENDRVVFSIEQLVDVQAEIDEAFTRWLNVLTSTAIELSIRADLENK